MDGTTLWPFDSWPLKSFEARARSCFICEDSYRPYKNKQNAFRRICCWCVPDQRDKESVCVIWYGGGGGGGHRRECKFIYYYEHNLFANVLISGNNIVCVRWFVVRCVFCSRQCCLRDSIFFSAGRRTIFLRGFFFVRSLASTLASNEWEETQWFSFLCGPDKVMNVCVCACVIQWQCFFLSAFASRKFTKGNLKANIKPNTQFNITTPNNNETNKLKLLIVFFFTSVIFLFYFVFKFVTHLSQTNTWGFGSRRRRTHYSKSNEKIRFIFSCLTLF